MNLRSTSARKLAGGALLATTSAIAIAIACSGSAEAGSFNQPLPITNTGTTDFIEYSGFGSPSPSNGDITNTSTGTINTTTAGHTRAIAINNSNLGAPNNPPLANRPGAVTNIVNQGNIIANTTGVAIAFSNFWGTISNSGTLTANSGNGIYLNNVNAFPVIAGFSPGVLTSITNSGTITAHGSGAAFDPIFGTTPKGNGIVVQGGTTVAGSIGNSGRINADQAAILVTGTSSGSMTGSTVTGSVGNTGTIMAGTGIAVTNLGVVRGGISNGTTATITTTGPAILVQNGAVVTGGITNGGTLSSTGAEMANFPSGAIAVVGATVNGDITNNKAVNSKSNGIAVVCLNTGFGCFTGSTLNGNIVNAATGTISATGLAGSGFSVDGINVNASSVNGNVSNLGTITSTQGNGIAVAGLLSTVTKGITNSGTITAGTPSHGLQGSGISVTGTLATISGSMGAPAILNSGTINAAGNGINLGTLITTNGDIKNTGTIGATTPATAGTASTTAGVGINVGFFSTVNGAVTNDTTGTIIATTGIANLGSITGAINNKGFLEGLTAAVNTSAGVTATTINQSGGTMAGSVLLSNSNADRLVVSGGVQIGQVTGGASTKFIIIGGTSIFLDTFHDTAGSFTLTAGTGDFFVDAPNSMGSTVGKSATIALGSGPAVLASTGTVEVTETGNFAAYNNHQTYLDVISTSGSVTGSLPTSVSDSPFFVASVTRDIGGVSINLDRVSFGSFAGLTRNQSQTGIGLDAFFNGPRGTDALSLLGSVMLLDPGTQLGFALDQLSGEQHAQSQRVALTVTESTIRLVQDRLGALGSGFVAGGSMASLSNEGLRYQVASLDTIYDDGSSVAQAGGGLNLGGAALWIRGFGRFSDSSSTIDAPGFNTTSGGAIIGIDTQVNDNVLAGIAASYASTSVSFNNGAGSTDLDSFLVMPYARIGMGDWYMSGVFGVGFDNFSTTRHIAFPGFAASATSSYSGLAAGGAFEMGYTFRPGSFTVTPVIGFDASHVGTDSFRESGAGAADLAVQTTDSNSAAALVGVRLATRIDNGDGSVFSPEAHIIYRHDFVTDRQQVGESFVEVPSGGAFTVVSSRFGKDAVLAGVGINYDLSPTGKLFATYEGEFSSGFTGHTVSAGYRMKF